jgi:uncharacterized membrane protein
VLPNEFMENASRPETAPVVHLRLAVIPLLLVMAVLLTDLTYVWTGKLFLGEVSAWLKGAGLASVGLAALVHLTDYLTIKRVQARLNSWILIVGYAAALGLLAMSLVLHLMGVEASSPTRSLLLSAAAAGMLIVTGWFGAEPAPPARQVAPADDWSH